MRTTGYLIAPLFVASAAVVLVGLGLYSRPKHGTRAPFLALLLSLELWSAFTFMMRASPDLALALVWDRLVAVAAISLFVTYFQFCWSYTGATPRWPVAAAYVFLALAAATVLGTDLAIARIVPAPYGYAPVVGPAGVPLVAIGYLLVGSGIYTSLVAFGRTRVDEVRNRLLYLAGAGFFPLIGAAVDAFTALPPMSIWANLVFSVLCTIAVLKHRLLDIRVAARRGVSHIVVSTLLAVPYVGAIILLHAILPVGVAWIGYAVLVLVFSVALRPLYGAAQELLDRLFYGQRYDYLLALRNFSREASSAAGLSEAAARLTELVRGALRASTASLLLSSADGQLLASSTDAEGTGLRTDGLVARWLLRHRTVLSTRALSVDPVLQNLPEPEREALDRLQAHMVAPVFTPQGRLAGAIVLGARTGGGPYTLEDLHLLEGVGTQAALALETSRLYADAERSRRTLEAWLQGVPDAVVIVDAGRRVRFANKAAESRLGVRAGQRSLLAHGDGPQRAHETILGREYEIASAPLVDPSGAAGLICVLRDTTERREQEEAHAQWERRARITSHLASIGEMAAGIAHEINNPLTSVVGYSGLLAAMDLGGDAKTLVSHILSGAERVSAITQRLLTFARQKRPERRSVSLNEIVRSTVDLRSYSLRTSNVQVVLDLDETLPTTVADAQQIQQVVLNLIMNAESAMKSAHGGGLLTIRTVRGKESLLISVADDGPGVPEELQERIFDPFFTTKDVGQGSGLGLSICHGIVSEHGGRISVHSAAGAGADFVVEIPLTAGAGAAALAPAAEPRSRAPRRGRVLAVDDEPAVRELLVKILESDGQDVEILSDGKTALERILSTRYDVMLLDVRMPGMSGVEVHERVRKQDPALADRIILITGDVLAADTREFVLRTGARCVTKPFDVSGLLRSVHELLSD